MFRRVTVVNNKGEALELDLYHPEKSGLILLDVQGLGIEGVNISTTSLGNQNGAIFNNSRMGVRNITMDVMMLYTESNIEGIRHKMQKYFLPNLPITLIFETDEVKAQIVGYIDKVDPEIFKSREDGQISIQCPDPCFYANDYIITTFSGAKAMFEFPFSNESLTTKLIEFSEILYDPRATINYKGSLAVGVLIEIEFRSEADTITIWNVDTNEELIINMDVIISNMGIQPTRDDKIEISTITGNKYARLYQARTQKWFNIIGAIDINSTWLQLTPGVNIFDYFAANDTDRDLVFTFKWKDAYAAI